MRSLFVFLLVALLFAGCSGHSGSENGDRIAAEVNGVEITRREVEFIYQRSAVPGADEAAARNQRRSILAGLVRAELLAQQGAKMNLDKSPEYLLALHDAQRRVLAGLAQDKIASLPSGQVSPEVVAQVIAGNPDVFSARKLFVFDEVFIPVVDVPLLNSLDASAEKGASLGELLDAVKAKGVRFQRSTKTMTSDQLQPAILKVLIGSKPKVPVVIRVEDRFSMILMVHSVTPVPVEGNSATVAATRMIEAQQRNEALSKKLSDVLDGSKIRYFGEYKADSAGSKSGVAPLPNANLDRAAGRMTHRFRLAVSLGISFMGGMLLLFMVKSILAGEAWSPRLWFAENKGAQAVNFDYDIFEASTGVKLMLFIVSLLGVAAMAVQIYLVWPEMPFWMMGVAAVAGSLAGFGSSRAFVLPALEPWVLRLRWLLVAVFVLIIAVALLVTRRIIFY